MCMDEYENEFARYNYRLLLADISGNDGSDLCVTTFNHLTQALSVDRLDVDDCFSNYAPPPIYFCPITEDASPNAVSDAAPRFDIQFGAKCIGMARMRQGCLTQEWMDADQVHFNECESCQRARDTCTRSLWHPDDFALLAWKAGLGTGVEGVEWEHTPIHITQDKCKRCLDRLEAIQALDIYDGLVQTAGWGFKQMVLDQIRLSLNLAPPVCEPFVGRESDVQVIAGLLETQKLVVLTGEGGVGKTELAKAVAAQWREEDESRRVFYFDCENLETSTWPTLFQYIGKYLSNETLHTHYQDPDAAVTNIMKMAGPKPFLLLLDGLDNLTHTTETVESGLKPLLARMKPGQHIVVTCRCALGDATAKYIVEPLQRRASLELFWQRAMTCKNEQNGVREEHLEAIEETHLEGLLNSVGDMPLAVLQIAGCLKDKPSNMAALLKDYNRSLTKVGKLPECEQPIFRAAWMAYHDLPLNPVNKARDLFAMLALLPCGMHSDMITALFGEDSGRIAASCLTDKNLAARKSPGLHPKQAAQDTFYVLTLPTTVRKVANVVAGGHALELLRRIASCYPSLTLDEAEKLPTREGAAARENLLRELTNVHAVLDLLLASGPQSEEQEQRENDNCVVNLLNALIPVYWWVRADGAAARMEQGAQAALRLQNCQDTMRRQYCIAYATFLYAQGNLLRRWGHTKTEFEAARDMLSKAHDIFRQLQETLRIADCLKAQADVDRRTGFLTRAKDYYSQAFAIYEMTGDSLGAANCKRGLAHAYRQTNCYQASMSNFEEALCLYRREGHEMGIANCLRGLGDCCRSRAEYAQAEQYFQQAFDLYTDLNYAHGKAQVWRGRADVAWLRDDSCAMRLYKVGYGLFKKLGETESMARCELGQGEVHRSQRRDVAALHHYKLALELYLDTDSKLGQARCFLAIANYWRDLYTPDQRLQALDATERKATEVIRQDYLYQAQAYYGLAPRTVSATACASGRSGLHTWDWPAARGTR